MGKAFPLLFLSINDYFYFCLLLKYETMPCVNIALKEDHNVLLKGERIIKCSLCSGCHFKNVLLSWPDFHLSLYGWENCIFIPLNECSVTTWSSVEFSQTAF